MEYVAATAPDDRVELYDLPEGLGGAAPTTASRPELLPIAVDAATTFRPIAEELREVERTRMVEALVAADGVRTRAAQLIEMPRRTFTLKLEQYKL
jgi:two-component system response regulator AtoC